MKNYFLSFCCIVIALASCRKVDDTSVFNESADQRLNAALAKYQTKLTSAEYGWKGIVETEAGGNFTFYFDFNDSNRVKMMSSFDSTSASTLNESSYRLKALQQPSILFDTYSYLHLLSDPNPFVNGGEAGAGLVADFEFYFDDSASSDNVVALVGRFNGTKTTLTKATQLERDAFLSGGLTQGLVIGKILNYYKRFVINNTDSVDAFVFTAGSYIISPDATGNLLDDNLGTNYTLTLGGLAFAQPLKVGTKTITELTNINYDATSGTITANSGSDNVFIHGVFTNPMIVDAAAPARFRNFALADESYWITTDNFHVNGVDDALGIANIPGYQGFSVYWPEFTTQGGVLYDYFAPVGTNTAGQASVAYGHAYRPPTITPDGRIIFPYFGTRNAVQIPAAATNIMLNQRAQVSIAEGFYLVQISADPASPAYHMVSAKDGLAWVTWFY